MPKAPKVFGSSARPTREQRRGSKQARGYGGQWERISRLKREACPVCEVCHDAPATEVDHITPFRGVGDPLRLSWSNLQSICQPCHQKKTRAQQVGR